MLGEGLALAAVTVKAFGGVRTFSEVVLGPFPKSNWYGVK